MRFINWLSKWMIKGASPDYHHMIFVRCSKCGETIEARIDLRNDLSIQYGDDGEADYFYTRKSLVGSSLCFERVEIELTFDDDRKLIGRNITGGEFLSEEEFHQTMKVQKAED
jgi:hypothetical protein